MNIDIDPKAQVSELAVSKQQMVEIAKAFAGNLTEVDEADYNTGAVDASEFQNVEGDANLPFN